MRSQVEPCQPLVETRLEDVERATNPGAHLRRAYFARLRWVSPARATAHIMLHLRRSRHYTGRTITQFRGNGKMDRSDSLRYRFEDRLRFFPLADPGDRPLAASAARCDSCRNVSRNSIGVCTTILRPALSSMAANNSSRSRPQRRRVPP